MLSGAEVAKPSSGAFGALERMQTLFKQEDATKRRFGQNVPSELSQRLRGQIEETALEFIDAFPKTSWTKSRIFFLDSFVGEGLRERIGRELTQAEKRKEEAQRTEKILEQVK